MLLIILIKWDLCEQYTTRSEYDYNLTDETLSVKTQHHAAWATMVPHNLGYSIFGHF